MAESFVHLGKSVTIVELAPQILTLFDEDFAGILQQYLEKKGVKIFTSEGIQALKGEKGKVTRGQKAGRGLEREGVWVPLGSTANKQGRVVGVNVCGGNATFPGVMGTTIFKTFDFNVAKTGLSMREAEKEGLHPVQAVVRGYDRAHYYPGGKEP